MYNRSFFKTFLVLSVLFLFPGKAKLQIICTDVNPDIVNTGNASMDIDVDNDLTPDFRITSAQAGNVSFVVVQGSQIGTNNFVLTNGGGNSMCLPLNAVIGSTSTTWTQMNSTNQQMVLVSNNVASGPWAGAIDQYLGLKFIVGANTYYGWARFSFTSNSNTYTFKDYAYNSVSNQDILAGQGCGPVSPTFSITPILCTGNPVTVTANTGTVPALGYTWTAFPAGPAFSAPNNSITSITFTSIGNYTISLAAGSGTSTGNTSNSVSVQQIPTVFISPVSQTICGGSSATLTAYGATSYSWAPAQGLTATSGSVVVTTPLITQSYVVTGFQGVCSNTAIASVSLVPAQLYNLFASDYSMCAQAFNGSPNSITVSLSGLNHNNFSVSAICPGNVSGINSGSQSLIFSPQAPYSTNTLIATNTLVIYDGNCMSNYQMQLSTSILPNPTIGINSYTPVICEGDTYTYTAFGADSYEWSSATPGSILFSTDNIAVANPTINSIFSVVGSSLGCNSATSSSTITVNPAPALSAAGATVCLGESATMVATGATAYNWTTPSGSNSQGATYTVLKLLTGGVFVYSVTGTAANNCTVMTTVELKVNLCTGLEENASIHLFKVYPIPATDRLFFSAEFGVGTSVEIIDMVGKIFLTEIKSEHANPEASFVDLNTLAPGLYVIKINYGGEAPQVARFLKK